MTSIRQTGPLPDTIGPYIIREKIGSGGMATVYRALDPDGRREVALKVLAIHLADNEAVRQRFAREARTLQQFNHPHILPVFDFGQDRGAPYMVMRLMDGRSLADLLTGEPLPAVQIAALTRQLAGALDYAHARGVIHRDIKPKNILFDRAGRPYLADFGVAFSTSEQADARLTATGAFVGTVAYASPEQVRGEPLDRPSDIYSLAVMVFEMCTGRPPFAASSPLALMKLHMFEPPPNPLADNPALPIELYHVLMRALAKSPGERHPSAMKFSEAVDTALGQHPLPQAPESDDWLHGDIRPVAAPPPAPVASPGPPAPPPEPTPEPPPDEDDFSDVDRAADLFAASELETGAGFDPGFDDVFEDEFAAESGAADDPPPRATSEPAGAPEPPPDDMFTGPQAERAARDGPIIRPLGTPPRAAPARRRKRAILPLAFAVIGAGLVVVAAAVIALAGRGEDGPALDATRRSAALGVRVDHPADWYTVEGLVQVLPGDPLPTLMLADAPVKPDGPYDAAGLALAVQAINPLDVFGVPALCEPRLGDGPAATFDCMAAADFLTPVHEPFAWPGGSGALRLPGTLPPSPASWPIVLLPGGPDHWLAVIITHWDGARWDAADATDLHRRVARSVRAQ